MILDKKFFTENAKTLLLALLIAIFIRSLFFQPFYIPSSSMEPSLLVGDRLFVSKYTYGYSKHSFPFSPNLFSGRILYDQPKRGDVIVFKTPVDNRTDYIKRLIGLPGDTIQFIDGDLFINNVQVFRTKINHDSSEKINCGYKECLYFNEKLPNGVTFKTAYINYENIIDNKPWIINGVGKITYNIPEDCYFFLGDNRDNSSDSRWLSGLGYVHKDNLVGKARIIFFSSDRKIGSILKFWKWNDILRFNRFLRVIK